MACTIEICHPAEFAAKKWQEVDTGEDPLECIRSPVFEVVEGLIVRALNENGHILYIGVYRNNEYIDVGPLSNVCLKYPWSFDSDAVRFAAGLSWPARWDLCENPVWMINAIGGALNYRQKLDVAISFAERVVDYMKNPETGMSAIKIVKQPKSTMMDRLRAIIIAKEQNYGPISASQTSAANCIVSMIAFQENPNLYKLTEILESAVWAEYNGGRTTLAEVYAQFADSLRVTIPLYDAMLLVTK